MATKRQLGGDKDNFVKHPLLSQLVSDFPFFVFRNSGSHSTVKPDNYFFFNSEILWKDEVCMSVCKAA